MSKFLKDIGWPHYLQEHVRDHSPYFAYALDDETMQLVLDETHEITDRYEKIPKRLKGWT